MKYILTLPSARHTSQCTVWSLKRGREEVCLAVRALRPHPGPQNSASPTNLSTVAFAKPTEWKLNRNVSSERYSIGVLSPKLHTHIACLLDISSWTHQA